MVEGAALEMLYRGNFIEGSNPSLSVNLNRLCFLYYYIIHKSFYDSGTFLINLVINDFKYLNRVENIRFLHLYIVIQKKILIKILINYYFYLLL